MISIRKQLAADQVAAAAVCYQVFVAAYVVLGLWVPATDSQLLSSDPLIQIVWPYGGPWGIVFLCAGLSLPWIALFRPNRDRLREGAAYAGAGALAAFLVMAFLYWIGQGSFPAFVPPEESSAPGLALGVGAGTLEEAVFRFGLLPLAFFPLRKRLPYVAAVVLASLLTGLGFAFSHEWGAGSGTFQATYFATRLVIPGVAMSLAFFAAHPAFLVTAHCAAHLGINLFFH